MQYSDKAVPYYLVWALVLDWVNKNQTPEASDTKHGSQINNLLQQQHMETPTNQ